MSKEINLLPKYKSRVDRSAIQTLVPEYQSKWYFSGKELEISSPSRMDGIDWKTENDIRRLYCSFIQKLGQELHVPQLTIASAIMFCHRFYMRQSLAKNDWQTIATACMFLAAKSEETSCFLDKVVILAYRLIYDKGSLAAQRSQSKVFFEKQKRLIWTGERLLLSTIAYDLNIQHPYKPLMSAMRKFNLPREVMKVAWNFVNDWLQTTLCLQYKPHYIAAGSLYLAAKLHNLQLKCWWQDFEVAPRVLEEAIKEMVEMLGNKRVAAAALAVPLKTGGTLPAKEPIESKEVTTSSPESCIASQGNSSDCSSPVLIEPMRAGHQSDGQSRACSVILPVNRVSTHEISQLKHPVQNLENLHGGDDPRGADGGGEPRKTNEDEEAREDHNGKATDNGICFQLGGMGSLDGERIREKLRKRRCEREFGYHDTNENVLERELDSGIEMGIESAKRARKIPAI